MGHARKQQVTIFTTNACNMRCKYCAAHSSAFQTATQKISIPFAQRGISDYFADGEKHQIRYYSGGEPTRAMDVIAETWDFAHSIVGNRLVSEIQTNCCFSADTADWLAEHMTYIWASIDGWPEVQNANRPLNNNKPSSELVMRNASSMRERTFVGVRMTIVPETVNRQVDLVEYFVRQNSVASHITQVDLVDYIKDFVKAWYVAEKLGATYINSFMVNFDEQVEYACRACLPTPHLTTDGFVSACDLGFYGNTPLKDLIYGQYDPASDRIKYDPVAVAKLRSRKCVNMSACITCDIKKYCGGGCLGRAYHETRDFYGVIPEYCWATRYLAEHLPMDRIKIPHLHP
jgi:radical SAM protein with 4Fe4S-binding SPASM domain